MILLALDFGNTHAHATLYRHGALLRRGVLADVNAWLTELGLSYGEVAGALVKVKSYDVELAPHLEQGLLCERVADYWRGERFAGMPVHYAKSLGEDRLISAWWAYKELKKPVLLINAGTFLTIDVVNEEGFQGGFILPGLHALLAPLAGGAQLFTPPLSIAGALVRGEALPQQTEDALQGVVLAVLALVQRLCLRWNVQETLLTGGSAEALAPALKALLHELPLTQREDLVTWALHEWYRRNIAP